MEKLISGRIHTNLKVDNKFINKESINQISPDNLNSFTTESKLG
jgi:hypothetical protein